uniref:5-dehydro-4-deoxyglucarate dehydratase n=1 Tax=Mesorhizobium sp. WSM4875 TaxID=3038539 RepID=UPI0024176685|nr:5-dehydro-4-deoxyglucarate dehydratase [Mesorhizobium sp. WSM4875]WIE94615.1 5-dehydro-4-deoxyglucarate dehydratase [Mesorhizobium sp. WSM4875]
MAGNLESLKSTIGSGLLSFPVTPFTADGAQVDLDKFSAHIEWLSSYPAAALFVAGGTGEFFSLSPDEVVETVRVAKQVSGKTPIIAGCGYGTPIAKDLAQRCEKAGADALLLLPQYLIGAEQDGLFQHIKAVCDAVSIGVIVYARDNCILQPKTLARLADACPNLIGFKDGHGDIELLTRICVTLGDRFTYIGGMPTAEVYAKAYLAAGVTTYSSAVYNFVPEQALKFYKALRSGDTARVDDLLKRFYYPMIDLRNRKRGYPVSIVKAGLRALGRDPGPVRAPLTDLTAAEHDELKAIIDNAFGEMKAA